MCNPWHANSFALVTVFCDIHHCNVQDLHYKVRSGKFLTARPPFPSCPLPIPSSSLLSLCIFSSGVPVHRRLSPLGDLRAAEAVPAGLMSSSNSRADGTKPHFLLSFEVPFLTRGLISCPLCVSAAGLGAVLSCGRVAQPPCPCEQPVHSAAGEGHLLGCALMLWVWALLPGYTCCFALPLCFVHGNICLFAEYREKEEEKKENESWGRRLMRTGENTGPWTAALK